MRCVKCGAELKDGAIFCIKCGTMQITTEGEPVERVQVGRASDQPEWPQVEPRSAGESGAVRKAGIMASGASGASGAAGGAGAGAAGPGGAGNHARDFDVPTAGNGRRIALIAVAAIAVIAAGVALGFVLLNPNSPESESEESSVVAVEDESSESSSDEASSSAASSSATSSAASSATSSAASSSAASSEASASASAAAAEPAPTITNEPAQQPAQQSQQQPQQQTQQQQPQQQAQPQQPARNPTDSSYVLPDSRTRYYSREELEGMSTQDLFYARNEIFARYGRMFATPELQAHFNNKTWYNPIYTPQQWESRPSPLTDAESKNADLMLQIENSR